MRFFFFLAVLALPYFVLPAPSPYSVDQLRVQAERGDPAAQTELCVHYIPAVPPNYAEAVKWCRKAAAQGRVEAQNNLGVLYVKGRGVPQDYAEAAKWYRKAADQRHAEAQHNLGVLYFNGHGVPQDYAEAAKWYRKAADQGHPYAQNNLGVLYAEGRGVPQDDAEAYFWLNLAVISGNEKSAKARAAMEARLSPEGLSAAQKRAREWKPTRRP